MIGPTTKTFTICNECEYFDQIYFDQIISRDYILTYCKHPSLPVHKYIQDYTHGIVETREWCPELHKKL